MKPRRLFLSEHIRDGTAVLSRVLDEMPEHIAILNSLGDIIWTNRAWKKFSADNEGQAEKTDVGANYLSVCEKAEKEQVAEAHTLRSQILRLLNAGDEQMAQGSAFSVLEYPCHSSAEKRWFAVALHRYQFEGAVYVAVIHQNVSIRRVLNERVAELQQRMSNLERAAAFSEWAGFVSHEIKNPLSVILTRAGLIRLGLKTRTQNLQNLLGSCEEIENTVEQIMEIVEGMLSMFKAAPAEEEVEKFSVQELIDEAVAMTRDFVGSIRVEVPQDGALRSSMIECNRIHVLQIITNLIRNAANALRNDQKTWIRLEVRSENDEVQFRVSDSGAGVPEELRSAFRRGGKSQISRRRNNGAGVGFKISRTLAELHGGELYLDESSPHTCFVLRLPRQPAQAARVA